MKTYTIYNLLTGLMDRGTVSVDESQLAANIPAGHGVVEGVFDPKRWKVDVKTFELVPYTPPPPSDEELAGRARYERDSLIRQSDWRVIKAADTGVPMSDAWVAYRATLRDITAQAGFPRDIKWPEAPKD